MKQKTISGHYGQSFSLEHNNRDFIPDNVDITRIPWNYDCVVAGKEVPYELRDFKFLHDYWKKYKELDAIYWSDRKLANQLEYKNYQRELRMFEEHRPYWLFDGCGLVGVMLGLLFLPLIIASDIYWHERFAKAKETWEEFKWEQHIRDLEYLAQKHALRDALRIYDMQTGTDLLNCMDGLVKDMAMMAGDIVNGSEKYVPFVEKPPRFATIDEVYAKLFEPAFREFQEKQRPCRRYEGTYLEWIREGQKQEVKKKQINKNSRTHKPAEAIEIVFGIGDMDNTGYKYAFEDAKCSEELLKDFCTHLLRQKNVCFVTTKELEKPGWQPPFNNGFIVLNLNVHCDEATPGVHLTCIPYSRNCKRGPAVQASLGRAMAGMGYPSTWQDVLDENGERIPKRNRNGDIIYNKDGSIRYQQEPDKQGVIDWIEDQKRWLQEEMKRRYDWEREYKGSHPRGNLSTPDYKVARAKERQAEIEKQVEDVVYNATARIEKLLQMLNSSAEYVCRNDDNGTFLVHYINSCSDEEYERIIQQAEEYMKNISSNERVKVHQALNEIVQNANMKQKEQSKLQKDNKQHTR